MGSTGKKSINGSWIAMVFWCSLLALVMVCQLQQVSAVALKCVIFDPDEFKTTKKPTPASLMEYDSFGNEPIELSAGSAVTLKCIIPPRFRTTKKPVNVRHRKIESNRHRRRNYRAEFDYWPNKQYFDAMKYREPYWVRDPSHPDGGYWHTLYEDVGK